MLDLYDRSIAASVADKNITSNLAIRTLKKVIESQWVTPSGLITHSDQGSPYTSKAFVEYYEDKSVLQSMSKIVGAGCWAHAHKPWENVWKMLPRSDAEVEFTYINALFQLERGFVKLIQEERCENWLEKTSQFRMLSLRGCKI